MAQQRSNVPKFGNWESEEDVPYTAYFDKARKVRTSGGKMVNPNDPDENPDLYSQPPPPSRPRPEPEEPVRESRERTRSPEESELKQFAESPARRGETANQQRHGSRAGGSSNEASNKRQGRATGPENHSYERSPLHNQARTSARSGGTPSPMWDGNKGSYDGAGRSKPRSNLRGDESPDKGAAVPKFGEWDENNPASADGYTHIFNKVREERNYGGRITGSARSPSNTSGQAPSDSAKCCCFSWGGK